MVGDSEDKRSREKQAMSVDTIGPIEATVHTTNVWLKELMQELGWRSRQRAYHALRVVLHTLRARLTVAEVADLDPSFHCWSEVFSTSAGIPKTNP
jgi:hypothetical protein